MVHFGSCYSFLTNICCGHGAHDKQLTLIAQWSAIGRNADAGEVDSIRDTRGVITTGQGVTRICSSDNPLKLVHNTTDVVSQRVIDIVPDVIFSALHLYMNFKRQSFTGQKTTALPKIKNQNVRLSSHFSSFFTV